MSLVAELRRRNVFRVAAAYLVVGWLLTEVSTTVLPTVGAPDWISRAIILIFALGFIPAVFIAWFYELTPEGIKREEDVTRDEGVARRRARPLDYVTLAAVILLIVFVGFFTARQAGDQSREAELLVAEASVAVLPFANMSNDTDNEYFSDGMTETLLHMLAQVPELKVAARTSSFAFKGQNLNVREIAAALGVAHILEGSVQRSGDRVRITAQLIRASDGFHVWSQVYDRPFENIFEIQDEIAIMVRGALTESLLGADEQQLAGVGTTNSDAYDLYLQAREARLTYSYGGLQAAEDLLKGALLIDPDFLDAKIELATCYILQMETGLLRPEDAIPEILVVIDQVLTERPADPVARATKIFTNAANAAMSGDFARIGDAATELEKIVAAHPKELQPRILLIRAYQGLQLDEKSIPVLESALEIDPLNPQIHYELGTAYMRLARFDAARRAFTRSLDIEPRQPNAYIYLGSVELQGSDGAGYVDNLLKAIEVDPRDHELPAILATFLYRLGLVEQGDDLRNYVLALAPTSEAAYQLELLRAISVGDTDAAVASARRAILDDVEERRGAWSGAVRFLIQQAVDNDSVDSELRWFDEQQPGIFDVDASSSPQKHRIAQGYALSAFFVSLPRDEALRRLERLYDFVTEAGLRPMDDPITAASIHALRGERDKAIDMLLERYFTQPVAVHLDWRDYLAMPEFAEIHNDARIGAAMERWEADAARLAENVANYLAEVQASS